MCRTGGAIHVLRKYAALWRIAADHFDSYNAIRGSGLQRRRPLEEILVQHSTFARNHLKERLYDAGLKRPTCELCGQGELWHGQVMGMILDHVNGVSDDKRLVISGRVRQRGCAAALKRRRHVADGRVAAGWSVTAAE
jgi:hypothetical protein